MTAGGVAGVLSWALATPMDVVKARLQMSEAGGQKYNGILDCMRTSVREEGVRVFFKGVMLNSVRAFPVNAITFLSYERLMKLFFSAWQEGNVLLPRTLKGIHSSTLFWSDGGMWSAVEAVFFFFKLDPTRTWTIPAGHQASINHTLRLFQGQGHRSCKDPIWTVSVNRHLNGTEAAMEI